jgi:probable HAF family extracellular repeat protein
VNRRASEPSWACRGPFLALAAGGLLWSEAEAQPTITRLSNLGSEGYPHAVSSAGATVVGQSSSGYSHAWRWTSDGTTQDLGFLEEPGQPSGYDTIAYAVSADGSVVAGVSTAIFGASGQGRAFRWTAAGGIQSLGYGGAYGVSGDGSVVVGYANNWGTTLLGACRWLSDGTTEIIGSLRADGGGCTPLAASYDGSAVTGYSSYDINSGNVHAFRWVGGLGMQDLGVLPGGSYSEGTAISADGSSPISPVSSRSTRRGVTSPTSTRMDGESP